MRTPRLALLALVGAALTTVPTRPSIAQEATPTTERTATPIAIVGARILGGEQPLEDATVVIADGRISRVVTGGAAPAGATVVDGRGAVVTAGLCDPLTSMGLLEIELEPESRNDEEGSPDVIRAAFRATDGYNPATSVVGVSRAQGLTSAGVIPTGGLISGQSAWVDLDGGTTRQAVVRAPLAIHVHLGASSIEGGHATAILRVREAFDDAREFSRRRAAFERNQTREFAPSRLDLEALAGALGKKIPVVFHVHRAADILTALDVATEFDLAAIIAGGAEAWRVADTLAAAKVPVIVAPLDNAPKSFDELAARADSAALLAAKGVTVALSTGETHNARKLRQVAGNAVRAGLDHDAAIRAITLAPARAFGLDRDYGSVTTGKVANLVVWSGDPLELSTRVLHVFIRGREVSLDNRQTELLRRYRTLP